MKKNKEITPGQLKALQAIFSRKGFSAEDRHEFIFNHTKGRTQSTKGLFFEEAAILLKAFGVRPKTQTAEEMKEAKNYVRRIYFLSLGIKCLNKGFESTTDEDKLMNQAKINKFCRERSKFKKNISKMTLTELKGIHKQFEAMWHKENEKQGNTKTSPDKSVQGSNHPVG